MTFKEWTVDYIRNLDKNFINELTSVDNTSHLKDCLGVELINGKPKRNILPKSIYINPALKNQSYWNPSTEAIDDVIDFSTLDKNIKILDIGTYYGIMPWLLQKYGFKNISSTNQYHSSKVVAINKILNIDPFLFSIEPDKKFSLPDKYDLILIQNWNGHWREDLKNTVYFNITKEKLYLDNTLFDKRKDDLWEVFGVWMHNQWSCFIDNVKQFLTNTGIAIINPHPFVYSEFPYFEKELNLFEQYNLKKQTYNFYSYFVIK